MLLRWIFNALALILVAYLFAGIGVTSFYIALVVAIVIGLINVTVKPIIIFFTLPFNILTLGLLTFVINALLFWFVSSFIEGFIVRDFFSAFFGSLVYSILTSIISILSKKN